MRATHVWVGKGNYLGLFAALIIRLHDTIVTVEFHSVYTLRVLKQLTLPALYIYVIPTSICISLEARSWRIINNMNCPISAQAGCWNNCSLDNRSFFCWRCWFVGQRVSRNIYYLSLWRFSVIQVEVVKCSVMPWLNFQTLCIWGFSFVYNLNFSYFT